MLLYEALTLERGRKVYVNVIFGKSISLNTYMYNFVFPY